MLVLRIDSEDSIITNGFANTCGEDFARLVRYLILIRQIAVAPSMANRTPETEPPTKTDETIVLSPWEEISGELNGITETDEGVIVALSQGDVVFPQQSTAAGLLVDELESEEGSDVSLLRTDYKDQPIRIQIQDS